MFLLISGSCGLVYEILWMKMLSLVIGNTVFSVATVLTAFMGGLALGSFLAGKFEERVRNPLKIYGILEGGIGIYALLLPFLIAGTEPLFRFIYQNFGPSFYVFSLLRFLVCGALLLVPTTLMGATLPVLSKHFIESKAHIGLNVGLLYGMNTLGAVFGCALAGFVLIPALGVTWTIYGAAFLNISIAVSILKLSGNNIKLAPIAGKDKPELQKKSQIPEKTGAFPEVEHATALVVMAGIGFSGIAAMIYQVTWTRVISLAIGSSVYAFSLIVTAFICGLALGSLIISRFIDRLKHPVVFLAIVQGTIGVAALAIVPALGKMPVFLNEIVFKASPSFQYVHLAEFAVIFLLILIPTIMMGAAVPVTIKICTTDIRRVGRFFGNIYAVNTVGAIIGSFITGFLLIPALGTQNSILIAVLINIFAAGMIFLYARSISLKRRLSGAMLAAVIAVVVWYPIARWDPMLLTSGPYIYAYKYNKYITGEYDYADVVKQGSELLYFNEGLHAVVSVKKNYREDIILDVNGKVDATARADAGTQLMLGHLPLLIHPEARDVLVIGLASGMTLGAVEKHPVKSVDVVEIEPAMVEASNFFKDFTGDPLKDPRASLILGDGRNHLAFTPQRYDVIISEPSNPWISGNANLFTKEFFTLAKNRLRKGGVMCAWVHAYSMFSIDFKTIIKTFHAVFPRVTLWEALIGGDYILIGSMDDLNPEPETLKKRLNKGRIISDLKKINMSDHALFLGRLVLSEMEIPEYTHGAPIHTDDNALLEYSAPKALLRSRTEKLLTDLYQNRIKVEKLLKHPGWEQITSPVADDLRRIFLAKEQAMAGFIQHNMRNSAEAIKNYENSLIKNPEDHEVVHLLAKINYEIAIDSKLRTDALMAYEKSVKVVEDFIGNDMDLLSDYFNLLGIYARTNLNLGNIYLDNDRLNAAVKAFEKCMSAGGSLFASVHNNLGIAYARMGRHEDAVYQFKLAIKLNPKYYSTYMNLGNTLLRQNKYREAIQNYQQVKKLKPDFALTHNNLGLAYYQLNQWKKAEREWQRAVQLNPDLEQARKRLNRLQEKLKTR